MVEQQRSKMLGARARIAEDALLSGKDLSDEQIAGYLNDLNEANMSGAISSKYDPYDKITLSVVKKVNSNKEGMKYGGTAKPKRKAMAGGGKACRGRKANYKA
jgi:hypothetical protein